MHHHPFLHQHPFHHLPLLMIPHHHHYCRHYNHHLLFVWAFSTLLQSWAEEPIDSSVRGVLFHMTIDKHKISFGEAERHWATAQIINDAITIFEWKELRTFVWLLFEPWLLVDGVALPDWWYFAVQPTRPAQYYAKLANEHTLIKFHSHTRDLLLYITYC